MTIVRMGCCYRALLAAGLVAGALWVTGCATKPEPAAVPALESAPFPDRLYRDAADRGEPVYRIDRDESVVRIHVFRDGALARLGHDHAVISRGIHGYAWIPDGGAARADLSLAVAGLIVDDPAARDAAGFKTEPSAADRDGTYRNMLASLEADRYPTVRLHIDGPAVGLTDLPGAHETAVELTMHGRTRSIPVPAKIIMHGNDFRVSGIFRVRQSDFGIKPFSVFGGALAVRDELELHFDLRFTGF